jgi:hypothetical protein
VDLDRDAAHYEKYGGRTSDPRFNEYAQTRNNGHYIAARPGDSIPLKARPYSGAVVFSPDGKWMPPAAALVKLRDVKSGQASGTLEGKIEGGIAIP